MTFSRALQHTSRGETRSRTDEGMPSTDNRQNVVNACLQRVVTQ